MKIERKVLNCSRTMIRLTVKIKEKNHTLEFFIYNSGVCNLRYLQNINYYINEKIVFTKIKLPEEIIEIFDNYCFNEHSRHAFISSQVRGSKTIAILFTLGFRRIHKYKKLKTGNDKYLYFLDNSLLRLNNI